MSWIYAIVLCPIVIIISLPNQSMFGKESIIPGIIYLTYCINIVLIRRGFSDPLAISAFSLFIYGVIPNIADTSRDTLVSDFGTGGAYYIYSMAMCAMIVGVGASYLIISPGQRPPKGPPPKNLAMKTRIALYISYGGGCALNLVYISIFGLASGSAVGYEDHFIHNMSTGSGVLLFAAPLAVTSTCYFLLSDLKKSASNFAIMAIPHALLYLSLGERKYIIIPALTIATYYVRLVSFKSIFLLTILFSIAWFVFVYLGFLRFNDFSIADAFNPNVQSWFFQEFSFYIAGETPSLYGTASAAYEHFIEPLPYFGDYLDSWKMALPQFLFGKEIFNPLTNRFTVAHNPLSAALGMGWGFSFWGEAYLVAGTIGIFVVALMMALVFRAIYRFGALQNFYGPRGAAYLTSLYFALWYQRNAFAHFLKEYAIYQLACVALCYYAASLFTHFTKINPARSHDGDHPASGQLSSPRT